ncbi:uncharacterized protein BO87DRAFT_379185 [Aspergillus neoniger CBS 115656]|uniref:Uncharacterized protein n=1 Tax=Aspergillus neoniger (strain CBS 115656) TaxID=1448310 RepID=A0A318YF50_ASPNB|nr:hypothetical protein BO87DRAFT_379185 [Aspergillus neoniger CBS 115656]PYH31310.1 hypothetical protein BO87DRAFT_379185 [Aspergillus neoniger CBS 115656]
MKFTLKLCSVLALAVSAMALPTTDTRVIQLRLWGETGCAEDNMGELGLYQSDLDECGTFAGPYAIHSITTYYVVAGYAAQFFTDPNCEEGVQNVTAPGCLDGDTAFASYKLVSN